jgi:KDO2-lipid IV(A) lauroyltransferase
LPWRACWPGWDCGFLNFGRTGERNLELAFPDLAEAERLELLLASFENLGRLLAVFSRFNKARSEALKDLIECQGLEHLDAALQQQRGVILFTGHIGAWELSSFGLSLFDHPLSFLVRRIDNPKIEAMIDRARRSLGNRTIDKTSAAREMLQILRDRRNVGDSRRPQHARSRSHLRRFFWPGRVDRRSSSPSWRCAQALKYCRYLRRGTRNKSDSF